MRDQIVFEDGEITSMLANPEFAVAFPSIVALKPAPVPGSCPPCQAKSEQRRIAQAYAEVRRRLAALTAEERNRLLDILEVREAVLVYFSPTNARVRCVFRRVDAVP